LKMRRLDRRV